MARKIEDKTKELYDLMVKQGYIDKRLNVTSMNIRSGIDNLPEMTITYLLTDNIYLTENDK